MSQPYTPPPSKLTVADLPLGWLPALQEIVVRHGTKLRPSPVRPSIEAWSVGRACWCEIMLPGGGYLFENDAERDLAMRALDV